MRFSNEIYEIRKIDDGQRIVKKKDNTHIVFFLALENNGADSIWIGLYNPSVYTYTGGYTGTENNTILFRWSDDYPTDYWNWTPNWPKYGWPINTTCATCGNNCVAIYPTVGGGQWKHAGCDWWAGAFVCKKNIV